MSTDNNNSRNVSSLMNPIPAGPSGRQYAEAGAVGTDIDPSLIDHNLSHHQASRGQSSASTTDRRAVAARPPVAWNSGEPSTAGYCPLGSRQPVSSEWRGGYSEARYGTASGTGGQSGPQSDEDSIGGDQMDDDDDETRTESYGGNDMAMTPQDQTGEGSTAAASENRRKRQSLRRGTACVRCRSKKLKCTGERPTCAVCVNSKKPVKCVYEEPPKKVPKIRRRQTRLQQIEEQIAERTRELESLQTARMNGKSLTFDDVEDENLPSSRSSAGASVQRMADATYAGLPADMPTASTSISSVTRQPSFDPPGPNATSGSSALQSYTASLSSLMPAPPVPVVVPSPTNFAYRVTRNPPHDSSQFGQQAFYAPTYNGFVPQHNYVPDMPETTSGYRQQSVRPGPSDPRNRFPTSLSSFLSETAVSQREGSIDSNLPNPEIPAAIMSKYGNDVIRAVELTTFLASRGLTFIDGKVDVAIGSAMEYTL